MALQDSAFFRAGIITGIHGLKGDLKVQPHSGEPEALLVTSTVRLVRPGVPPVDCKVVASRWHKGRVLLRLAGLDHIQKVEHLVGAEIESPIAELPPLVDGEHYWFQLEGLQVVDKIHGDLGTLVSFYTTAAHDTYVVDGPRGEVLIPVVEAFIVEVDLGARVLRVNLPDGLLDLA